jgi:hypothetical protein
VTHDARRRETNAVPEEDDFRFRVQGRITLEEEELFVSMILEEEELFVSMILIRYCTV